VRKDEPYVKHIDPNLEPGIRDNYGPVRVPSGELFMMGDNRDNSMDSRYWKFLPEKLIRGKAAFIYFSWDADTKLPRIGRMFRLIR
jgi:signal peptidase I